MNSELTARQEPESVGELTRRMKSFVEERFADVWVVGEVSNLSQPKSGHCYLTLKDETAQLSAVVWRSTLAKVQFNLKNGLEIVCRGRLEIYPPHGKYQMIITQLEPKGIGALELAFRQLHDKLAAEGLFLPARKKPIPKILRRIAVVTSPTGAAIRDFLNVLGRRTKRVDVVVVPVKVQGSGASREIAAAIEFVNRRWTQNRPDALALIRGGGSVEDLWTFNEEPTIRSLAASQIPTITGIGHEIDVSLCDLVADLHALTPSDAAARIVPEDSEQARLLLELRRRLDWGADRKIQEGDDRIRRLEQASVFLFPERRIVDSRLEKLENLQNRQTTSWERTAERCERRIAEFAARLESLSPLSVLGRGYSLTQKLDGTLIRNATDVEEGEIVATRLQNGTFQSRVLQRRD